MNYKIFSISAALFLLSACGSDKVIDSHHEEEEVKFRYTSYSDKFELFAEADPFLEGDTANVLSHFTLIPEFKPLREAKVTLRLRAGGVVAEETLDKPDRPGIYSFNIVPPKAGEGTLEYIVTLPGSDYLIAVEGIRVFTGKEEAHAAAEAHEISSVNTAVFLKEQSWKTDFSTSYPDRGQTGLLIKTTGIVQPAPSAETIVSAGLGGVVSFSGKPLAEGMKTAKGDLLFSISGSSLAENNSEVRYAEAKNNFEKAKSDLERIRNLAAEKIVAERELVLTQNLYDNTKAVYEALEKNFSKKGQLVKSPASGFIRDIYVKNGQYVESGQPLISVSDDEELIVKAEVQQKYMPLLNNIATATLRLTSNGMVFSLNELDGKIMSTGKAAGTDSYLLPVSLIIKNNGYFSPGSLVELNLKTEDKPDGISIPLTALLEEQGVYSVYVQLTPELFEKREVKTGDSDGVNISILSGLSLSDRIVTHGAVMIKLAQSTGALDAHAGHVH